MRSTILVVEDDTTLAELWKEVLEEEGYRVVLVEDGMDALGCLPDVAPDLIICDLLLPSLNGDEVVVALERSPGFQTLPIIVVTAVWPLPTTISANPRLHVVEKPFEVMAVIQLIRQLLRPAALDQRPDPPVVGLVYSSKSHSTIELIRPQ